MTGSRRWRISADVRSADIGAAAAFDQVVDWDDVPPLLIPGLVDVLSSWMWQEGRDTRWWLGAVVEARSAVDTAQRAATVVAQRIGRVRTRAMTVQATESAARPDEYLLTYEDADADEELDTHAIPGSSAPFIVPVRACAYARHGERLAIEWISGWAPLAHVTVEDTESLTIGLFERRPPLSLGFANELVAGLGSGSWMPGGARERRRALARRASRVAPGAARRRPNPSVIHSRALTGPDAQTGELLIRSHRHVVVDVGDVPAGQPVLDRYSDKYLPEGNDHPEDDPIEPHVWEPDSPGGPST